MITATYGYDVYEETVASGVYLPCMFSTARMSGYASRAYSSGPSAGNASTWAADLAGCTAGVTMMAGSRLTAGVDVA